MRDTPASRAATSMLRNPVMFAALEEIGSSMERGTLPSAAWCSTTCAPAQASRQSSSARMSPSMKRNERVCCSVRFFVMESTFSRLPVAKLSRPTTFWSSFRSCSARCEPMKPAAPVTSQQRGSVRMRPSVSSYDVFILVTPVFAMSCACRARHAQAPAAQLEKGPLVLIHHGALGKSRFHGLAGGTPHALAELRIGKLRQALHERGRVADRKKKSVRAAADHARGTADIGVDDRLAERHGLQRGQRESLDRGAAQHCGVA